MDTNADLSIFKPYKIDCENCCGLCCVALYFSKMDGFPEDKTAGIACKNLQQNNTCQIHTQLLKKGLKGCMTYDCFGAGQHATQFLAKKPDWKELSKKDAEMIFKAYMVILQLHQVLWYLTEASILCLPDAEKAQTEVLIAEGKLLGTQCLETLQDFDIEPFREKANTLLKHICTLLAARSHINVLAEQNKNFLGKNMKRKNLTGNDFSMSLLIAANLEQANLYGANFLGADLRDTNIQNTDLSQSLFLTQMQVNAAKGNSSTILPPYLTKPTFWE